MHWTPKTRISVIADAVGVTRFEKLKRFFHCNDNQKMVPRENPNFDKQFKVRPVLNSVLNKYQKLPQEQKQFLDEQIIPTKCRLGMRQYLPKKTNKWGIKVWARCGVSGMVYDFELYKGKSSTPLISDQLGVMSDTVLWLTSKLPPKVGHKVYYDNIFSISLLRHLQDKEI